MRRNTGSSGRTRGLVLGAGGFLGGVWSLGALSAIQRVTGQDIAGSDLIVGTSAGSVLAMLLRAGLTVDDLCMAHGHGPAAAATPVPAVPLVPTLDLTWPGLPQLGIGSVPLLAHSLRNPSRARLATWCAALAPRGRGRLTEVGKAIRQLHGARRWPAGTLVAATNYVTGSRATLGRAGSPRVSPARAVMASCAVPSWYAPIPIRRVPHVDGAVYSACNADLALGCDEVWVLAPMAALSPDRPSGPLARLERWWRRRVTIRTQAEVRRLTSTGATVRLLTPNADDLASMGMNMMDSARAPDVLACAVDSVAAQLRRGTARPGARLAVA